MSPRQAPGRPDLTARLISASHNHTNPIATAQDVRKRSSQMPTRIA